MSEDGKLPALNLVRIKKSINVTAARSGRQSEDVKIVAVSKKVPLEKIRAAYESGIVDFGENYLQEALFKQEELTDIPVSWHFIGHIQSNKVKNLVNRFALIHTVDRLTIAEAISRTTTDHQDILVQVNLVGEESKSGAAPSELPELLRRVTGLPKIRLRGLMFMPPYTEDKNEQREFYSRAKMLFDEMRTEIGLEHFNQLSMGTSHDFETAVEFGATILRLGTVIFGQRS